MITVTEYKNQNVGVFGLGKAGEAAVASLLAGGANVWAWDDAAARQMPDGRCQMSNYEDWPWTEMKALVLSPGIPFTHKPHEVVALAKKHNCPVIGDIELLYRACPQATYVGITGTNGKSTTTTLLGHILKSCGRTAEIGGNLGTPALALAPLKKDGAYVLELSSYQLDLVKSARFNIAVWLNISPDHIDRHGDLEGYINAKRHVFDRQQAGDVAVIAVDDEHSRGIRDWGLGIGKQKWIEISSHQALSSGIYVKDGILYDVLSPIPNLQSPIPLSSIVTLTGRHNWQNAAAAYAAARALGLKPDDIYKAMQGFAGLRHRLQLAATIRGVKFINDSKATNADATANALAPYDNIYWIAGGQPKAGGIESLKQYFPKIAHAFLIGEAEKEFAATLEGKAPFSHCGTLDVAVKKAAEMAVKDGRKNAVVLLSPACASFDQFKNFEERGDAFCTLVETLQKNSSNPQSPIPNPRNSYAS